ncbi:3,4-dihydroxyphenylacetate 2,3-dioxygenase [Salmonella enterica subsp. arizonae]|uniref:3,4-dihydroxyphenylacetate 2,3-dioxygenase n=1 Tax=Salmonella enterica subsp. arizonae TaxID=59203 RepID=A0A379S6S2_SALER|nr:3,4-dihydroxyphenylacetate 2,3-dioxygenase [Salmonella enterica subsp. arizonae]
MVSISAFCTVHDFADSRKLGEAIIKAIEKYDGTVAVFASGSLSHRFIDDQRAEEGMNSYTREFDHQMDERVVKLWREGNSRSSAPCCRSTPTTATAKATCMTR